MVNSTRKEFQIQTACLLILTAIGIAGSLYFLKPVLIPFVLAMFVAIGLTPVVEFQVRRLHFPHALAVVCTLVLGVAILGLVGLLVSTSVVEMNEHREEYALQADKLLQWGTEKFAALTDQPATAPAGPQLQMLEISSQQLRDFILRLSSAITSVASNGFLVIICLCFLLFGGTMRRPSPSKTEDKTRQEIVKGIRRYINAKMLLSSVTGILVGLILWFLGVKLALVFGLLAFLLNFIPSVGSIIATLLPLPVVLLSPSVSTTTAILAIALPGTVQFVIGNVIEPRMMGKALSLHPIAILLALVFWGMLWGVVGMFLAAPMTAALRTLLDKHPLTRPAAELLSGNVGGGDGAAN